MTEGHIDSATLYEVVNLLRRPPAEAYPWAWQSALEATCLIIEGHEVKIAATPGQVRDPGDHYGTLLSSMTSLLGPPAVSGNAQSLDLTKRWARDNAATLRQYVDVFVRGGRGSSLQWLHNYLSFNLTEHVQRLGAPYDEKLVDTLGLVLGYDAGKLEKLWTEIQTDDRRLRLFTETQPSGDEDFIMVRDAFVLSALLRGRYHEYVATESVPALSILHHPMREPVLPPLRGDQESFQVSSTELYFAKILLAAAFQQRSPEGKMGSWAENVATARRAIEDLNLGPKSSDEKALASAAMQARSIGIHAHPKAVDSVIDLTLGVGVGSLVDVVVEGWEGTAGGAAFSVATWAASRKRQLGERIGHFALDRRRRLRHLAQSIPGRIVRRWRVAKRGR